jgi:hypothetical protein
MQSPSISATMPYEEFLRAKLQAPPSYGFEIADAEIHPILKPHQRDIVRWAVHRGRAAIFAAFGLGKTIMQLEASRILAAKTGGRFLIVAPLGVRAEFMHDAAMLGITLTFVRSIEECGSSGLYITNYETVREGKLDPRLFAGVSLDEAGCLRGFGGTKTFRQMMAYFEGSGKFRIVATATPSPNDYIELLAYAAFLDIMDVSQGKTRVTFYQASTFTGTKFRRTMKTLAKIHRARGDCSAIRPWVLAQRQGRSETASALGLRD